MTRNSSGSTRSGFSSDGYETIELTKEFDDMGKQPQQQPTAAGTLSSNTPQSGITGAPTTEDKSKWDGTGLQVHLVMAFADHGTLQEAVQSGKFTNSDGSPHLVRMRFFFGSSSKIYSIFNLIDV